MLTVAATDLAWTPVSPASSYDVIRGDLAALHGHGGNFGGMTIECLGDDLPALTLAWAAMPDTAGAGFWILVRGVGPLGNLPWNSFGPALSGSRDDPPTAIGNVCP